MTFRLRSRSPVRWLVLILALGTASRADAQNATPPLAVAAIASIDAVLDDVDYLFDASGHPQYAQFVRGLVANLNELKGIDRGRPLGVMVFFPQTLGADPDAAVFIPVADIEQLKSTARLGNVISLEDDAQPGRLVLKTPEKSIPVRLEHGYAFLSEKPDVLLRTLPDPSSVMGDLLSRYDGAISLRREGIPVHLALMARGTLDGLLASTRSQAQGGTETETQLVQDSLGFGGQIARALFEDTERLEAGWRLERDARSLVIEGAVVAGSGKPRIPNAFQSLAEGSPRFGALAAEAAPMGLVLHVNLPVELREMIGRALDLSQQKAEGETERGAAILLPHVRTLFSTLRRTAEAGQLDAVFQVVGGPPDHFTAIGGIALADGEPLARAVQAVLPFAQASPEGRKIDMNAMEIRGVAFHRVRGVAERPQDQLLYGEDAALLVGVAHDAIWFAIGGEEARDRLEEAMGASGAADGDAGRLAAARLHLTDWLGLVRDEGDEAARQFRAVAQRAFPQPEDDQLEIAIAPVDRGLQLRITLEEGYLRMIGHAIAVSQGR
ncbi:MAG: hypothetical protein KF774_02640 [Planctomyces sp.]|nr:hypothetical protein [Planctomyces sp.]